MEIQSFKVRSDGVIERLEVGDVQTKISVYTDNTEPNDENCKILNITLGWVEKVY